MINIFYHKEDNDGVFSAAIIRNYLVKMQGISENDIRMVPSTYKSLDDDVDKVKELVKSSRRSYMTDISFNNPKMQQWFCSQNNTVWIDHHAPAIKESVQKKYDDVPGERSTDRSAILLAYKYFYDPLDEQYKSNNLPYGLLMLSCWDSWTYEKHGLSRQEVQEFNIGVNDKYNIDFDAVYNDIQLWIDDIVDIESIKKNGKLILSYINKQNASLIEASGDLTWYVDGRKACAIFTQGPSNSVMFNSVKDKVDNGIVFKRDKSGSWVISLYNTNDGDEFHCGDYMKKRYNGGGHSGAAGGTVSERDFIKMLKYKRI